MYDRVALLFFVKVTAPYGIPIYYMLSQDIKISMNLN
jgi:hypothetical protein